MTGGSYIDPYSSEDGCDVHTENIAVICRDDRNCFGQPLTDVINQAYTNVEDLGSSIKTRETTGGLDLLRRSTPNNGTQAEQRDAQCKLLTHSLWIIDPETILNDILQVSLAFQVRCLPDESRVFTWVDDQNTAEDKSNIENQFTGVRVADSIDDLESWVEGYLDFQVNPDGSEQTVIAWSNEVANQIDNISI